MEEEHKSLCDEDGKYLIEKETEELEKSHAELLKEIQEKVNLMDETKKEKGENKIKLRDEFMKTLGAQAEQYELETEKSKLKLAELRKNEAEYTRVQKEYRERFHEFDKQLKLSRKNYAAHEREVAQMSKMVREFEDKKKKMLLASAGIETTGKKKKKLS